MTLALLACALPSCAAAPPTPRPARPARPARVAAAAPINWPRREVLDLALDAYRCGRDQGYFQQPTLTVIDYSLPSTEKRLWVIDLQRSRILFNELVAHGLNTGDTLAASFSNRVGSKQSSLGLFRTDETYFGRHGISLRLSGLEPGVNDQARDRAIVMHGANYVSRQHIVTWGKLGRSWGCPALDAAVSPRIIDRIQGGSAVFAYYPDRNWLGSSPFLHCDARWAKK
ncbi:MAG: murein L,D-transpeptidase catalytic domain family protein [bacterium]